MRGYIAILAAVLLAGCVKNNDQNDQEEELNRRLRWIEQKMGEIAPAKTGPVMASETPKEPQYGGGYTGCKIKTLPGCEPCKRLVRDLTTGEVKRAGWTVGEGPQYHFWVVPATALEEMGGLPRLEYYMDGRLIGTPLVGYGGNVIQVLSRHPKVNPTKVEYAYGTSPVVNGQFGTLNGNGTYSSGPSWEPLYSAPVYAPPGYSAPPTYYAPSFFYSRPLHCENGVCY